MILTERDDSSSDARTRTRSGNNAFLLVQVVDHKVFHLFIQIRNLSNQGNLFSGELGKPIQLLLLSPLEDFKLLLNLVPSSANKLLLLLLLLLSPG